MNNDKILNFNKYLSQNVDAFMVLNRSNMDIKTITRIKNIALNKLAIPEQIHSPVVKWIETPGKYFGVDGLLTNNNNITLLLKVADCVPVYILDIKNKIIGLIHSGWRGTLEQIVPNAIKLMLNNNSSSDDIKIYLGPSIGQCCYEVGIEVAEKFQNKSKIFLKDKKWKVGLKEEICTQLLSIGIKKSNIKTSKYCTYESLNCCSYRRDKENAGRMFSFFKLI